MALEVFRVDKRARRHSELAAPLVCKERAIQGRVPFRVFRNRKIEVDKLKSCRRKRDFHAPAALKQVQGDEIGAPSFRTRFGIARLK